MFTKQDAVNLYGSLQQLGSLSGAKFSYAVAKNVGLLKPEIQAIQESLKTSEEYNVFDKERIALAEKNSKKDTNNKPIRKIGNSGLEEYEIEDMKTFEVEFVLLKEKYSTVLEAREKQIKEYQELLKTECIVQLYKIKPEYLPNNITVDQTTSINEIIE